MFCLLGFGFGGCLGSYQGSVYVIDFVGPSRPNPFTLLCLRFSVSFWVLWLPLRFFVAVSSSLSFFLALSGALETQTVLRFVVPLVFFLAVLIVFDLFDNLRNYTKVPPAFFLLFFVFVFFLCLSLSSSLRPRRCACARDKQGAAYQTATPMTSMAVYIWG